MSSKDLQRKPLYSARDHAGILDEEPEILVDRPETFIGRITLNFPKNNNRMGHAMRAQLLNQLMLFDQDPDVRCTIIRGAGKHFCSGADLGKQTGPLPFYTNESDGQISRNTVDQWFMMQDMAKPIVTQVHGECLGTGMELAAASDLCVVAEDAKIGYPAGRNMGLGDFQVYPWLMGMRNALSVMLTADTMSGEVAVKRGFANKCCPESELEETALGLARRVAKIPADLLAYNKRSVYRAFEAQGMRTNLRHGVDLEALMFHSSSGSILARAAARGATPRKRAAAGPPRPSMGGATGASKKLPPRPAPATAGKSKPAVGANSQPKPAPEVAAKPKAAAAPKKSAPAQAAKKKETVPLPQRSSRIVANPAQSSHATEPQLHQQQQVPLVEGVKNSLESSGVHLHLHNPVNIHIHQGGKPKSKL